MTESYRQEDQQDGGQLGRDQTAFKDTVETEESGFTKSVQIVKGVQRHYLRIQTLNAIFNQFIIIVF